jgi:hypothetical protein
VVHNAGVMSGAEHGLPNSEAVESAWDWSVVRSSLSSAPYSFAKSSCWRPNAFDCVACERLGSLFAVFVCKRTHSGSYWPVAWIGWWWYKPTGKFLRISSRRWARTLASTSGIVRTLRWMADAWLSARTEHALRNQSTKGAQALAAWSA